MGYCFLIISGLSAGFMTAAAFVAFITMLGVFPKFAEKTRTANACILYENCLIAGILLSVLLQFFFSYTGTGLYAAALPKQPVGILLLLLFGFFGGIYIGFLIGGLSEVLNVIPIYARKTHISKYMSLVIFFLAIGKGFFVLLQFFVLGE